MKYIFLIIGLFYSYTLHTSSAPTHEAINKKIIFLAQKGDSESFEKAKLLEKAKLTLQFLERTGDTNTKLYYFLVYPNKNIFLRSLPEDQKEIFTNGKDIYSLTSDELTDFCGLMPLGLLDFSDPKRTLSTLFGFNPTQEKITASLMRQRIEEIVASN
jgi:hypothetical protein